VLRTHSENDPVVLIEKRRGNRHEVTARFGKNYRASVTRFSRREAVISLEQRVIDDVRRLFREEVLR
jgi:hypothetical protein